MVSFRVTGFAAIAAVLLFNISFYSYVEYYSVFQEWMDWIPTLVKLTYITNTSETFDFIIVGAGSAGSVVAMRLSENPRNRILLLEAGGNPNPITTIPSLFLPLLGAASVVNTYLTVEQNRVCIKNQGRCYLLTGRGIGGSSNVNAMFYSRGSPNDYNAWAVLANDTAWSYENVLKAFKRVESYHGSYPAENHYGSGGELFVGKQESSMEDFFQAARDVGLESRDANALFSNGYGMYDINAENGSRAGSYEAFIKPILSRKNLSIYRYAQVTKVHLDSAKKAYAVTYVRHGVEHLVRTANEIVLSAGALESPKILMLSGIGPAQHLKSLGIEVRVDLPVGKLYQDHHKADVVFKTNRTLPTLTFDHFREYLTRGAGPYGWVMWRPWGVAYTSSKGMGRDDWPDLEIEVEGWSSDPRDSSTFSAHVILLRPKSTGELQLNSNHHSDFLRIDPRFFSQASDMTRLVDGIIFAINLFESSETFKSYNITLHPEEAVMGCDREKFRSRAYWECYTRRHDPTSYHPHGTCRLGRRGDLNAVVDSKLRVMHTSGLRVIDNSIIPAGLLSAHSYAPAVMIGEIGSSFILKEYSLL